jgi:RecG-like helicase
MKRAARPVEQPNDTRTGPPDGDSHRRATGAAAAGVTPIGDVRWRQRVTIEGRVQTVRVQPVASTYAFECVIEDRTGVISIIFPGRKQVAGIDVGTRLRAEGLAGEHNGRLTIYNPVYTLLAGEHRQ